jgi:hypothetical protein
MIKFLRHISDFIPFFKKKEETEIFYFNSIESDFQNIRQYEFEGSDDFNVRVIDSIPMLIGKRVEFKERVVYINIPINLNQKIVKRRNVVHPENIYNSIFHEEKKMKLEIDKSIYYQLSEMGRKTALILSKRKNMMPMFTISSQTTSDSLFYKITVADKLLTEANGVGVKNITLSNSILSKLKSRIENGIIIVNNKEVNVYSLPEKLDSDEELCLLLSSISRDSQLPGLVLVKKPLHSILKKLSKYEITSVEITQRYGLQECGMNSNLHYLRFFKT